MTSLVRLRSESGQSFAELVILLPLLAMMAAGAAAITYMCWQGLKTQQAANLAARIEGQERVAGGPSQGQIRQVNGLGQGTDRDITDSSLGTVDTDQLRDQTSSDFLAVLKTSVYGKYRDAVRQLFNNGERSHVFVPGPTLGANTDQVKVIRLLAPPKVMGLDIKPVVVEATAYGGEDTHMYALPRWGCVAGAPCDNAHPYWKQLTHGKDQ